MVDCVLMAEVMDVIHLFVEAFQDYDKARAFARDAVRIIQGRSHQRMSRVFVNNLLQRGGTRP